MRGRQNEYLEGKSNRHVIHSDSLIILLSEATENIVAVYLLSV